MTAGRPLRVDIDPASTLAEALAAMRIAPAEFLWIVRCDDPEEMATPPGWWFLIAYYLMRRCADDAFPHELRRRVDILSQRIYARAWKVADAHRTIPKKPGVGDTAIHYPTVHGDLTIDQAAELLGCNPSTLHRRMGRGMSLNQAMQKKKWERKRTPC